MTTYNYSNYKTKGTKRAPVYTLSEFASSTGVANKELERRLKVLDGKVESSLERGGKKYYKLSDLDCLLTV